MLKRSMNVRVTTTSRSAIILHRTAVGFSRPRTVDVPSGCEFITMSSADHSKRSANRVAFSIMQKPRSHPGKNRAQRVGVWRLEPDESRKDSLDGHEIP